MLSPSPTQQPPVPTVAEQKKTVLSTPARPRPGQTPTARFFKAVFRPILKALYYVLRWIVTHFPFAILIVFLLLVSIFATTYFTTGQFPYGIGGDQFNFHIKGTDGGGTAVKNWMYALRDGDDVALNLLDKNISQPPDATQLTTQFSQSKAHLTWKDITVLSASGQVDGTVDSFVQVDLSATGPGGDTSGMVILHFTTIAQGGQEFILKVNTVDFRAPLG
ncbi:MAG: hypothetical protein NVSMB49_03330 [Ktedonobacteraceae bacterium]